jgi:kumamolisin
VTVSIRVRAKNPLPANVGQITHEEYDRLYGSDPNDLQAVADFASSHGLMVEEFSVSRRTVVVTGTVAQVEGAFGVQFSQAVAPASKTNPPGQFRMRTGHVLVPAAIANAVEAVMGLDNRPAAAPHFRRPTMMLAHAAATWTPKEAATRYNMPTAVPGPVVAYAIISLGGGHVAATDAAYFDQMMVPRATVTDVSVDGATNTPGDPADEENNLDIQWSGGIYGAIKAQGAQIYFLSAPNTDAGFLDALTYAIHTLKVRHISISWGSPEANWSAQAKQQWLAAVAAARALGCEIYASSGDNGSGDGMPGLNVDFPASCPGIVGCGATALTMTSETGWTGAGGGYSSNFSKPAYQANAVQGSMRGVPDISAVGDPNTGVVTSDGVIGGTSAVSPFWAGMMSAFDGALPARPNGLLAALYSLSGGMHDVIGGSNGAYTARAGWDEVTGLGTPNGMNLFTALQGTVVPPPVNPPPAPPPQPPPFPPPPVKAGPPLATVLAAVDAQFRAIEQAAAQRPGGFMVVPWLQLTNRYVDAIITRVFQSF